jgi:hypothetical protein
MKDAIDSTHALLAAFVPRSCLSHALFKKNLLKFFNASSDSIQYRGLTSIGKFILLIEAKTILIKPPEQMI